MASSEEIFVSYSHDSESHMDRVRAFADKMRAEGVDCDIDQYHDAPPEGWPRWMAHKVRDAKFVLVICSRHYHARFEGQEEKGRGLGAKWEGGIIINELYEAEGENIKFIPVVFDYEDRAFIPPPLRPTTYYNIGKQSGYEDLYRRLTNQPKVKKPALGRVREIISESLEPLPPKKVKTNPQAFLVSPIDIALWDVAKWRATFFEIGGDGPPKLGIGFLNEKAAKQIFEGWMERYGEIDAEDELRISFIAGTSPDRPQDYKVTISADLEVVHARLRRQGLFNENDRFIGVSRINGMEPISEDSSALPVFKRQFEKFGEYTLVPGVVSTDGRQLAHSFDSLGIKKRKALFRHLNEISEGDIDAAVLPRTAQL